MTYPIIIVFVALIAINFALIIRQRTARGAASNEGALSGFAKILLALLFSSPLTLTTVIILTGQGFSWLYPALILVLFGEALSGFGWKAQSPEKAARARRLGLIILTAVVVVIVTTLTAAFLYIL